MAQKTKQVQIQVPDGQTVTVEVPEGATQEQILRYVKREYDAGRLSSQPAPEPQPTPQPTEQPAQEQPLQQFDEPTIEKQGLPSGVAGLVGGQETMLSMATGAIGQVMGGLAGLASLPFGADVAAENVGIVSNALTYEPRTREGKKAVKKIGELFAPINEWTSEKPAELAFDLANSPAFKSFAATSGNPALQAIAKDPALAGAAGAVAIPAIMEGLGLKGLKSAKTRMEAKKMLAEEIANGNRNIDNIAYRLDANGALIKNKNTKQLQKLYPDKETGTRAAITFETLTDADKKQVSKMLEMVQEGRKKGRAYIQENRPADVIGQGITERVKRLVRIKKNASRRMKDSLGNLETKQVDLMDEAEIFKGKLADMGIEVTRGEDGRFKIDTRTANINLGDGVKKAELEQLLNNLDTGTINGAKAHRLKKLAQESVDYSPQFTGKKSSVELESAVKELATGINEKVRALDKNYAKANDTYRSMADSLGEAQKRLGGINLESELAGQRLGGLSKRIAQNFNSRTDIIQMIDGIDAALAKNGIRPKSNIKQQVAALTELEELFKLEKQQSPFGFQGRIESAMQAASDPNMAAVKATDKAINSLRGMFQKDFDERVAALKKMLDEEPK